MVEIVVVEISGIDVEDVYFYNMFIGGSFGYWFEFDYICQVVEIVIKFKGILVKLIYFCEEDFVQDFLWYIIIGCGIGKYKDGKVILMNVDICGVLVLVFQMGCMGMSLLMVDIQLYEGVWDYLMLNLNNNWVCLFWVDNFVLIFFWCFVGVVLNVFIYDMFLDEIIYVVGVDLMLECICLMGYG